MHGPFESCDLGRIASGGVRLFAALNYSVGLRGWYLGPLASRLCFFQFQINCGHRVIAVAVGSLFFIWRPHLLARLVKLHCESPLGAIPAYHLIMVCLPKESWPHSGFGAPVVFFECKTTKPERVKPAVVRV